MPMRQQIEAEVSKDKKKGTVAKTRNNGEKSAVKRCALL